MRKLLRILAVMTSIGTLPSAAYAQASIAGVVKDTSGAVLPGVTVETSSPALIEKTRAVVTDGSGQYKIVDLRPGTYTVTFTLAGFSTVKREGIELTGSFVANVNADLKVGSIEETITVTSEAPIVDVQSVKHQAVMTQEVLTAVPTGRAYQNLHVLVPGVTINAAQDVGGNGGDVQVNYTIHGGQFIDSRTLVDGLSVAAPEANGGRTMYVPDVGMSQETVITTSQALGESDATGVTVNVVPREGGNTFKGMIFATGATESMQSANYTQALKDRGLRAPNRVERNWDLDNGIGGPIFRDRLWFFGQFRYHGANNFVAGMFLNKNVGNPNVWTYEPDLTHQNVFDSHWVSESMRLTWQATDRNKINAYYEDQLRCVGCTVGGTATMASEAQPRSTAHPDDLLQITWSSPITNRLLVEAGVGGFVHRWSSRPRTNEDNPLLIPVTEQAGAIPGLQYRASNFSYNWTATYPSRASLTYTTGAHNMKVGYNGVFYNRIPFNYSYQGLMYRFNNGVPNQLTEFAYPLKYQTRMTLFGLYAQDQWTVKRLTLQGGVRFDRQTNSFPAAQLGPNRFVPVPIVFGDTDGADVKDITPRMAVAYDVFGNGKTAVKVNLGKYPVSQDNTASPLGNGIAPMARLATSASRTWNDVNKDFVPDCDLTNPNANGECLGINNRNFGTGNFSTTIDPAILSGWGVRPYTWSLEASVQREVVAGVSATFGYFRRWLGNFIVTDNLGTTAADYTLFNLPAPADSRLPISGVVSGIPDVSPEKFPVVDNQVTRASNYGNMISRWNGVDLTVNARRRGMILQGGLSTGRTSQDICEVAAKVPEVLFSGATITPFLNTTFLPVSSGTTITPLQYCHVDGKFLTQFKFLGAYTLPRIDVQLSGTFQGLPGPERQATYNAPNAVVSPLLGRSLSGNAANVAVNLLPPLAQYGDRINQLDFRVSKIFNFSGKRAQISLDLFNALNSDVIQTYNNTFIPNGLWLTPTLIMPARLAKVTAQLDF